MDSLKEILVTVIVVILALILFHIKRSLYHKSTLPPGPVGLPLLGHFLHILKNPHLKLTKWTKKYGKLYTIQLGSQKAVVISDPKMMREIFSHNVATGKFQTDTMLLMSRGPYGIISSEGKAWDELRKFCIRSLRSFGLGQRSVEPIILTEAKALVDWIKANRELSEDRSVILKDVLQFSSVNTIWTMVSGERIPLGDSNAKMNKLMHVLEKAFQRTVKSGLMFYPSLKYIAPNLSGFTDFDKITGEIYDFIKELFAEHRKTRVEGSPRDLIDCYIDQIENTKDRHSSFYGSLGEINSIASVMELFLAGTEATGLTINWGIIYLATKQDVQQQFRNEIDLVIGRERPPSIEDRSRMAYAEATILEVFRHSSVGPLGVLHELTDDLAYEEYLLPKGTILWPNIYGVHYDKKIWKDPETFQPERFLQKGKEQLKEALVTFQPGKRSCIGERLAKDILFIFLTSIVQHFKILSDSNTPTKAYYEPDVGLVLAPGPHKIIFVDRD